MELAEKYIPFATCARYEKVSIAQEGFVDRSIFKIIDAAFRILTSIYNTLKRIVMGFSRSEVRYYKESNLLMVKKIMNMSYGDIRGQKVPFPEGMIVDYETATNTINGFLSQMAPSTLIKDSIAMIKQIDKSGFDNVEIVANIAEWTESKQYGMVQKDIIEAEMRKVFISKSNEQLKSFQELFVDMTTFQKVMDDLIDAEKYYHELRSAWGKMGDLNKIISRVVSKAEANVDKVDMKTAKMLYDFILMNAQQLDLFAAVCSELQRVEHNFVGVLRTIYKIAK